ncbi:MAG: hypothetical protein ABJO86_12585 [Lentilitoribacter sp.]
MSLFKTSACLTLFATACIGLSTPNAIAAGDECRLDLNVRFIESAPRDRFVIKNNSTTDVEIVSASFDLSNSQGNLIFDTEDGGTGVEVFQKFRSETDKVKLVSSPAVRDGDSQLDIAFETFAQFEEYQFSIDVDDQNLKSDLGQIRVTGGELAGAEVTFLVRQNDVHRPVSAKFDKTNSTRVFQNCT